MARVEFGKYGHVRGWWRGTREIKDKRDFKKMVSGGPTTTSF